MIIRDKKKLMVNILVLEEQKMVTAWQLKVTEDHSKLYLMLVSKELLLELEYLVQ